MKTKSFKKNMLVSLMTMILLASVIVGGTYAYFTDSVAITGNTITAGDISIEAQLYEGTTEKLGSAIDNIAIDNFAPGDEATYVLEVDNSGSLDADYKIILNTTDDSLLGALTIKYDSATMEFKDGVFQTEWTKIEADSAATQVNIVITFNALGGNEYEGASFKFDVNVLATQVGVSTDISFYEVSDYTDDILHTTEVISTSLYNKSSALSTSTSYSLYEVEGAEYTLLTDKIADFDVESMFTFVGTVVEGVEYITVDGEKFYENDLDNVKISVGNSNFIYMPAYKVVNNNLYVASVMLNIESALGNGVSVNTSDDIILLSEVGNENYLTLTGVTSSGSTKCYEQDGEIYVSSSLEGPAVNFEFAELADIDDMIFSKKDDATSSSGATCFVYGTTNVDNNMNGDPSYMLYVGTYASLKSDAYDGYTYDTNVSVVIGTKCYNTTIHTTYVHVYKE